MNLMNKIPREFYKLFASKYMDYYQQFLTAIYEESGKSFSLLGLTEGECRAVMNERIAETTLDWSEEQFDEEGELLTRSNMASICLKHLEDWGWLKRDYDEALNSYVVSFPGISGHSSWSSSRDCTVIIVIRNGRACWRCTVIFIRTARIVRRIMRY